MSEPTLFSVALFDTACPRRGRESAGKGARPRESSEALEEVMGLDLTSHEREDVTC